MVYIPYEVVERYMRRKWIEAKAENPALPEPTVQEVNIQWFKWLDFVPNSSLDLERFQQMFPASDRYTIEYRMLSEFKGKPVKKKTKDEPIAQPLGEEPE